MCVCGDSPLERHAAKEFSGYAAEITGRKLEVSSAALVGDGKVIVSVGKNALTETLLHKGLVQLPADTGTEGFVVRSAEADGKKYLVLLGGSPKATLYAVYHYLESVCGVGFFGDGEHIPRLAALPIEGINISEQPRFPFREYMMDCEYTSYWWDWGEWKYEVDWSAKHRFNLLSSNFDFTATWRRVWKKFGVDVPPTSLSGPPFHPWTGWHKWDIRPPYPEPFQEFQADLCKKFVDYGQALGISLQPEALRQNHIWFDLLSRLAWNPEKIPLDGFLEDYAQRRYGKDAAARMVLVLRKLVASVYGSDDVTPPFYQIRITEEAIHTRRQGGPGSLSLAQRSRFIPHLHQALGIALGERDRLERSPLYQRDLVDIGRQYQAELFNVHVTALYDAFTTDRDYYELVRFYYRPRVSAFIRHLRAQMKEGSREIRANALEAGYHEIEQAFVTKPFRAPKHERYQGTPIQAALEILKRRQPDGVTD